MFFEFVAINGDAIAWPEEGKSGLGDFEVAIEGVVELGVDEEATEDILHLRSDFVLYIMTADITVNAIATSVTLELLASADSAASVIDVNHSSAEASGDFFEVHIAAFYGSAIYGAGDKIVEIFGGGELVGELGLVMQFGERVVFVVGDFLHFLELPAVEHIGRVFICIMVLDGGFGGVLKIWIDFLDEFGDDIFLEIFGKFFEAFVAFAGDRASEEDGDNEEKPPEGGIGMTFEPPEFFGMLDF